jgi:hypothetical protein
VEKLVAVVISAAVAATSSGGPLRDASRLSGFRVRHAVATTSVSARQYAALVSRAPGAQLSSRAWYDVARHRLFVQRTPQPGRRALLHQYVRALIDQNFHLARIATLRSRDRDRWDAAQGMVDGVASLSSGLNVPGHPLAAQLRYVGGRKAVTGALRAFPQTTEQLLHVDKFLERERALPVRTPSSVGGIRLTSSQTYGELDVRELLRAFHVPDADAAAEGWGGGRVAVYGDVAVIVLRWDTPEDAAEWQVAVVHYIDAAFPGAAHRTCPPLDGCWGDVSAGVYKTTSVLANGAGSAAVAAALLQQD